MEKKLIAEYDAAVSATVAAYAAAIFNPCKETRAAHADAVDAREAAYRRLNAHFMRSAC